MAWFFLKTLVSWIYIIVIIKSVTQVACKECSHVDKRWEKTFMKCVRRMKAGDIEENYCACKGSSCYLKRCYNSIESSQSTMMTEDRGCLFPEHANLIKNSGSNCMWDRYGQDCIMCICDNEDNCNRVENISQINYTTSLTTKGTTTRSKYTSPLTPKLSLSSSAACEDCDDRLSADLIFFALSFLLYHVQCSRY